MLSLPVLMLIRKEQDFKKRNTNVSRIWIFWLMNTFLLYSYRLVIAVG